MPGLPLPPEIGQGQLALDPVNGVVWYKNSNNELVSTTWSWLQDRDDTTKINTEDTVTINGNLIVEGTTVTVDSETVVIKDNFIVVNSSDGAATSSTAGIEVERGASTNVQIRWNEATDKWEITNDGSSYGAIAQLGSINLGSDTVGNYMSNVSAGTGISISHTQSEGSTATITNAGVTSINGSTGAVTGIVTTSDTGTVTSAMIANSTIVNADISSSAAIGYSKLNLSGSITSSDIVNGTIVNEDISSSAAISYSKLNLSGSITSSDITNGTIVNEDISSSASIALSKLASGSSGQIIVVNSGGTPSYVSLSGDATISNTGVINVAIPLSDLTNVNASSPTNDQVLAYDSTTSKWIAKEFTATVSQLDGIGDVIITSAEEFQSLVYDGTNWVNKYASTVTYVRNAESTTLTTGTVVYLFGATGDHASVKRADNDSDTTSSKTVGLVAANIASAQNGPVITRGYVDGIDLSSGYSQGDIL